MSDDNKEKETYRWTDKNKNERVKFKMLFLLFLAVLFIITLFLYFKVDTSEKAEDRTYKEEKKEVNEEDYSSKANEIEEHYKNKDDKGKEDENEDDEILEEDKELPEDANEYEDKYVEQYSQELIDGLKSGSKGVMDLYFAQDDKNEKWDKVTTKSFRENLKNNLSDKERSPESYEVFTTKQYNDDEVIIGVIVDFKDKVEYYNLIYKEEESQVRLDEIVYMWEG